MHTLSVLPCLTPQALPALPRAGVCILHRGRHLPKELSCPGSGLYSTVAKTYGFLRGPGHYSSGELCGSLSRSGIG